ncbi:MAG TPA: phosphotransferase [Gaiellales bacterium]|jgi:hypothetical protein
MPDASDPRDVAEVSLTGGLMTAGVVRVGDTVRRPTGDHSPFVHEMLLQLHAHGVAACPQFLGVDPRGREILTYLPGWVPPNLEHRRWDDGQIVAAARIVREVHDATAASPIADGSQVVCHGDLSPCNFVFVDGIPRYLIDFDSARPGTRRADLAYMAWMWLIGDENSSESPPPADRLVQLGLMLETYGLDDRRRFAEAIGRRQLAVRESMVARGSSPSWVEGEIRFVERHAREIDAAALD